MAHYKRGKCRRHGRITFTAEKTLLKSIGVHLPIVSWRQDVPRWVKWPNYGRNPGKWNRDFHSRPHRARTKLIAGEVRRGRLEPDCAIWPVHGRPNKYFW